MAIRAIFVIAATGLVALSWWTHRGLFPVNEGVAPAAYVSIINGSADGSSDPMAGLPASQMVIAPAVGAGVGNLAHAGASADPDCAVASDCTDGPGMYREGFINQQQEGRMSHVSSMAPLEGGRMGAVWYSGTREGARDVNIYFSRYGEGQWSRPEVLVSRESCSQELGMYVKKVGNAILSRDDNGRLWLFYSSMFAGGWSGTSINYKYSDNDGLLWSRSRKLILSPFFNLTNNVKNKAIALRGGGLLIPTYHELLAKRSEMVRFYPSATGARYTKARMTRRGGAIQPAVVSMGGRTLGAFFRNFTKGPKRVLYAESPDLGLHWGPLMITMLSNPDSGLDVMVMEHGLLAVVNNLEHGRARLTLEYSADWGRTWRQLKVLEDTPGWEFSYPTIARGTDGDFHLSYTYNRTRIRHVTFDTPWLIARIGGLDG